MIRLNVSIITETAEAREAVLRAAVELTAFSLRDPGCVSYDIYESKTNDDRLLIVETWESEEALKAHAETDHYKRLAPELRRGSDLIVEKFNF